MAYAANEDLNLSDQRLIELTDNSDAPGEVDQDVLDVTLAEAQALVDALLSPAGISLPYADEDVPPLVRVCTGWIWAYRLYRHREVMEIPQSIKDDYLMAIQMLKDMAAGIIGDGDGAIGEDDSIEASVPSVVSSTARDW